MAKKKRTPKGPENEKQKVGALTIPNNWAKDCHYDAKHRAVTLPISKVCIFCLKHPDVGLPPPDFEWK